MKKTSSAANAFGPGSDLVGKSHKGQEIVSASRNYMTLANGEQVARAGNRVDYEYDPKQKSGIEPDNTAYMTDDL